MNIAYLRTERLVNIQKFKILHIVVFFHIHVVSREKQTFSSKSFEYSKQESFLCIMIFFFVAFLNIQKGKDKVA